MSKIGIFAGNDLFTAIVLPQILSGVNRLGINANVYFPKPKPLALTTHHALRKYRLIESELLTNVIHPILDEHPVVNSALCFSPQGLVEKCGFPVKEVENVNTDDFLKKLEAEEIDSILSIRCLQIFSKRFLGLFEKKNGGFLWNLHCGPLPQLRGAMPIFWTMLHERTHATLSLHEIVPKIDEGRLVDNVTVELKPGCSLLETTCQPVDAAVSLILGAINKHEQGLLRFTTQNDALGQYFSYPTNSDIESFLRSGKQLLPSNPIPFLVNKFSVQGTGLSKELQGKLQDHIQEFERTTLDDVPKTSLMNNRFFSSSQSEQMSGESCLSDWEISIKRR